MSNYHRTELIGRIGKDPEIRYMANGDPVANFSVAVSESWKSKQTGEKVEKTTWYRCNVFGKLCEVIKDYAFKGQMVFVTGRMENREYTDKDGVAKSIWELRVDEFKMLSFKDKAENQDADPPKKETKKQSSSFDDLDDVPF